MFKSSAYELHVGHFQTSIIDGIIQDSCTCADPLKHQQSYCFVRGHTVRGTKPGEEAAGGAVMAVRVPGLSPFTVLLEKKRGRGNREGLSLAEIMVKLETRRVKHQSLRRI